MLTIRSRVTKALELLTEGLHPYIEQELKAVYQDKWIDSARASFREDRVPGQPAGNAIRWDAHALLTVMWDQWNSVFRHKLSQTERSLISELREFRNRWAHQAAFDFDDAYRVLDSTHRILKAIDSEKAELVAQEKREFMYLEFEEEEKAKSRKVEFLRDKRTSITIYFVCCFAIVFQMLNSWGSRAGIVSVLVVFLFVYLIYQRLIQRPTAFGPHECAKCGKIIYSESCPYCEVPASTLVAQP